MHILFGKAEKVREVTWICSLDGPFDFSSFQVSTVTRKYFHLTTAVVYTFGVAVDPDFLCLSSYVAVCVLILIEVRLPYVTTCCQL